MVGIDCSCLESLVVDKYALSAIPAFSLCGEKSGDGSPSGLPNLQHVCVASYALKKCKKMVIEDAPRLQSVILRGSDARLPSPR